MTRYRKPERERLAAAAAYHGPNRADKRATVEACRALLVLEPGNPAARHACLDHGPIAGERVQIPLHVTLASRTRDDEASCAGGSSELSMMCCQGQGISSGLTPQQRRREMDGVQRPERRREGLRRSPQHGPRHIDQVHCRKRPIHCAAAFRQFIV